MHQLRLIFMIWSLKEGRKSEIGQPHAIYEMLCSMKGDTSRGRRRMGFVGRAKRTIWMWSPFLHPTYNNFLYKLRSHIQQIIICIQIVTIRYEAGRFFFESNLFFHRSFAFLSTGKCKRYIGSFSQRICPFRVSHEPGAEQIK